MPQLSLERSIKIHANPAKVWSAFTEPEYTHQYGGEFVTDWNVGSSLGWRGLDGKTYTHGQITQIDPGTILQYNLFRPKTTGQIFSTITYELHPDGEYTTLLAREDFTSMLTEQEYTLAGAGWYEALAKVKEQAEK